MVSEIMISEKFRRQLRQEAEQWWQEGLINASLYEQLSERYQFREIEAAAGSGFTAILLSLGGVLLGLGAITFVAANWQEWPREFRVFLLLALFVGVNAAGFYLWRRPSSQQGLQRLGHGLLLTGALVLGANMALMSQMFHQSGQIYELYLIWSLGVMAMAYSLRLTSLGVLAWILLSLGYLTWWFTGSFVSQGGWIGFAMHNMALLVSLLFVPFAYWCRSRVIFGLAAIGFAIAFTHGTLNLYGTIGGFRAIAYLLPPALLWSYDTAMWKFSRPASRSAVIQTAADPFQAIARSLAVCYLGILFYFFSFHWLWSESSYQPPIALTAQSWRSPSLILFLILTGLGWLRLGYRLRQLSVFQEKSVNNGAIACFLMISAVIFVVDSSFQELPIVAPFLFNLMLFLLSIALLRDGLAMGIRRTFWGGMSLLVLGIVSRMLEYNTDLLLKAFVLALCGISVIIAGLWFERHLKPTKTSTTQ